MSLVEGGIINYQVPLYASTIEYFSADHDIDQVHASISKHLANGFGVIRHGGCLEQGKPERTANALIYSGNVQGVGHRASMTHVTYRLTRKEGGALACGKYVYEFRLEFPDVMSKNANIMSDMEPHYAIQHLIKEGVACYFIDKGTGKAIKSSWNGSHNHSPFAETL